MTTIQLAEDSCRQLEDMSNEFSLVQKMFKAVLKEQVKEAKDKDEAKKRKMEDK